MGPQLDSCGRKIDLTELKYTTMLQWGRNLTVAEGEAFKKTFRTCSSFNGAAT